MPFSTIKLIPGVSTEETPTLLQSGLTSSENIRFRAAPLGVLVEKIGGWVSYYASAFSSKIRKLAVWQDLSQTQYLAVGAESELAVIANGSKNTITPQTIEFNQVNSTFKMTSTAATSNVTFSSFPAINNLSYIVFRTPVLVSDGSHYNSWFSGGYSITGIADNATSFVLDGGFRGSFSLTNVYGAVPTFTTTAGSDIVVVYWPNWFVDPIGYSVGQTINFYAPTTVGGITISGDYEIYQDLGTLQFSIRVPVAAASSQTVSMNNGKIWLTVYLGQPATGTSPPPASGTPITTGTWSIDNWGEILLACPIDGPIFQWDPKSKPITATAIQNSPLINRGFFIAAPSQIIVSYGSSIGVTPEQDPLLIRWCPPGDLTTWIASDTNQAGSFHIPTGSMIVGGLQGPQQGYIWTDVDLWSVIYIGPPFVLSFTKIYSGCGLVGQHAAVVHGNSIFWMAAKQFFRMDAQGSIAPIPCPVWDFVFQDFDSSNAEKVQASSNSGFNEVRFDFPSISGGTGENDKYVKFNVALNAWDFGETAPRTAWVDQSLLGPPIGAGLDNIVYQHEIGYDDDGSAMVSKFRTGWTVIEEGWEQQLIDMLIPDFRFGPYDGSQNVTKIKITIYGCDYPSDPEVRYGPFTISADTRYFDPQVRARMISLEVECLEKGSFFRMGASRVRLTRSGRN